MTTEKRIEHGSSYTFLVEPNQKGLRLDVFFTYQFPLYSRSFFKKVIEDGLVTIKGVIVKKPGLVLKEGDAVVVSFPSEEKKIELNKDLVAHLGITIVHQEKDFAIINKPAGVIVHAPDSKHTAVTLVEWVQATFSNIKTVGYDDRPGIVHRLDKDTSGLMVIPLTQPAFAAFSGFFKDRTIKKTYLAVVKGHPEKEGSMSYEISRHPTVRNKMTTQGSGRESHTDYTVVEYFEDASLVEVRPQTGRTHQIRVHFNAIGHPLLGDIIYGSRSLLIGRQALHAYKLQFRYNDTSYEFLQNVPNDFKELLNTLHSQKK